MILVDSSVWIDYFNGVASVQTNQLDRFLGFDLVITGDLILAEVLQGFTTERDFNDARKVLTSLAIVELGGEAIAIRATRNFRTLRRMGITVRKTIDTIIATRCIENDYELLHNDRDFEPFAKYLGLRLA